MKHIAYISTEYPHNSTKPTGGIGSFVKIISTSLIKKDYKVTVFLCLSKNNKIWFDDGVRIVEIKSVKPSLLSPFKDRLKIAKRIKTHIKNDKIDLVEAADWEGLHAFCNFKIPLITRIHGSVTYFNHLQNLPKSKLLSFLEKKALQKSTEIIAVSNFSGEVTKKVFQLPSLDYKIIYNGIDTATFSNVAYKYKKKEQILYFGTLVRKKGVVELAYIFNKVHQKNTNAKLILVGKDTIDVIEKKSTWEILSSVLSPSALKNVSYKGVIAYKEISKIISEASICVFPSFAEAFPISWLEAMAMEKPIVASAIGWGKESIEDNVSGLLEHPKNHQGFADKINDLLENPKNAEKIGKNARERVLLLFNQKKIVLQNINIYKKVLGNE